MAGGAAAAAVGALPRQTTVQTSTPAVVPHYTPMNYDPPRYVNYTVKAGESPWSIAAKVLGNGSRYKEIQALTRWGGVDPGQKLKIPMR